MGLVNYNDLFKHAEQHSYAVGAFNVINLQFLNGVLEAAEEMHSPVILNIAEVHFKYVNIEQIYPAIKFMADRACVPVVLNLDHGLSVETVVRALRCGFSAVMYDGSTKSYEENVEETRLVVKMAHAVGVSVEAELGHVGGAEGAGEKAKADKALFTDPAQAEEYVARTGVDALAVSVGNVHGFYDGDPELDFDRIAEIKRRTGVPIVLHGGSGISDDDFRKAIKLGIRKINFFTEMSNQATIRIRELVNCDEKWFIPDLLMEAQTTIKETVKERMEVFGSARACGLPGNICPTGGQCATCTVNGAPHKAASQINPVSGTISGQGLSEAQIASIITQAVSGALNKR